MSDAGRTRTTLLAVSLGVGGFLVTVLWAQLIGAAVGSLGVDTARGTIVRELVGPVATLAGGLTVLGYYFLISGRGQSFLDVRIPGRREAGYVVAGTLVIVGLAVSIEVVLDWLNISSARHSTEQLARNRDPDFLLVLIPASVLFIAPGEELLYRNLVQKLLAEVFPSWRAIGLASALFALVHLLALAGGGAVPVAVTLGVTFLLSVVLGVVYERTHNLVVPILVHGVYNAVVFASLYLQYA